MKVRAIANDQEGYVRFAYGKDRPAARAQLCKEMDVQAEEEGHTDKWLKANRGFLTYQEVPDDTDESDAG